MRFKCRSCGQWHQGVPGWAYPFPMAYFDLPPAERASRGYLGSELCVVDDVRFFVRGTLEFPIQRSADRLVIGVWNEVAETDFFEIQDLLEIDRRSGYGPYAGRLSAAIPTYEHTEDLAVQLRLHDDGIRPTVALLDETHALGRDQQLGLSLDRIQALYAYFESRRAPR